MDILDRTREFWLENLGSVSGRQNGDFGVFPWMRSVALLQNLYKDPEHFWHGCVPPNCSINSEVKDGKARFLEEDKVYASKYEI